MTAVKVSVVTVNYNGWNYLDHCLTSLLQNVRRDDLEVIVVDNASQDASVDNLRRSYPSVKIVEGSENVGFSRGCNRGAQAAIGRYLLFLNNDTIIQDDFLKPMADFLEDHPRVGVLGPRLVYEDGTFQLSSGSLPSVQQEAFDRVVYALARRRTEWLLHHLTRRYASVREVEWVTGACLLVRREVFEAVGGFDENMFMYFEDKDLCKRIAEQGWRVVYFPEVTVIHRLAGSTHEGNSKKLQAFYRASQLYYYRKHLSSFQSRLLKLYLRLSGLPTAEYN